MKNLILAVLLAISASAWATEDSYEFDSPEQRQLFLSLTEELRCPMCQNQNIADSDAMIAHDMRRKVYNLVRQGKSGDEVITYMKSRYGDFISYKPPVTPVTLWLWLAPLLFAVLAFLLVVKRRKSSPPEDMAAKLAKAEAMLKQDNK
ncbi:cytochrome c-type biogenesis protein [Alteromonas lipolytica]|uniref:Cytochrome c-type biogenesis protein n=1 Tax=Alteromonas lipolytica TaxID=1856405 RepID=A0A1E8F9Z1_9ALTE|nr:cytochrome c-type biogenesis protein [Alteromonas lipolytica]OFI32596.1 cytochrome C biogenesis protein [Alteromonas lipolytica]GGF74797.1 cytochrome c-type biogenesis protein CcmH [Alteromonas lipolytica]